MVHGTTYCEVQVEHKHAYAMVPDQRQAMTQVLSTDVTVPVYEQAVQNVPAQPTLMQPRLHEQRPDKALLNLHRSLLIYCKGTSTACRNPPLLCLGLLRSLGGVVQLAGH